MTALIAHARRWAAAAGDLLLAAVCPGCGAPGLGLCSRCRWMVETARPGRCVPDPCPPGFPVTTSCGPYADPYRAMILAHKEHGALLLAPVLGRSLARAVEQLIVLTGAGGQPVELVPVPSSAAVVRRRGYDAVTTMTRHAARRLRRGGHQVVVRRYLRQRRRVADQAGLTASERLRNLSGALAVRGRPARDETGWLVLVDDVTTTGATLGEAARTLRAAGLQVLGAATVADTRRRSVHRDERRWAGSTTQD